MAKYRVLEEERGDGTVFFVPQVKYFLFWVSYWRGYDGDERVDFKTLEEADAYIKDRKGDDDHESIVREIYYDA